MSLIACKDKEKKYRVQASGNLKRQDYYCPNKRCSAIMILVDCDDETRQDHFRIKVGHEHLKDCPYTNEDIYLQVNNLTNQECAIIESTLTVLKINLSKLDKELKKTGDKINITIKEAFQYWLGYNLNKESHRKIVLKRITRLNTAISNYKLNKFDHGFMEGVVAYCVPWQSAPIHLTDNFFDSVLWNETKRSGTIIHETMHQIFFMNDFRFTSKIPLIKRNFAENWTLCYEEIVKELWSN